MAIDDVDESGVAEARVLIVKLYEIVDRLEAIFPGRRFTPDGHMVGSIGECLARYHYGVVLHPHSYPGCDGVVGDQGVEVKATQGTSVGFRCEPKHLLVLKLRRDGNFDEVYNGPGAAVWTLVTNKMMPKNGQHQVSLSALRALMEIVPATAKLPRLRA